jgi:hypothetical protein
MAEICKHCSEEIFVNFCGVCGQKKLKRIDLNYLKEELQYTLLHTNKGFLYSVKMLIKSPGRTTAEFIAGNRVNHYKPILLLFILSGIIVFLSNILFNAAEIAQRYYDDNNITNITNAATYEFIYQYNSFIMIGFVPIAACFTWISFKKWGDNYFEHVIINANLLSTLSIFTILIIIPLQFILRDNPPLFLFIPTLLLQLSMLLIAFWFFIGLYSDKPAGEVILRTLLHFFLMFTFIIILTLVVLVVAVAYLKSKGIDPMQYLFQ